jgi:hypothetical protein
MAARSASRGSRRSARHGVDGKGLSNVERLPKFGNYIDGAIVPPASNEYLATEDHTPGNVRALIPNGDERDAAEQW